MSLWFEVKNARKLWRVVQHVNNIQLKEYNAIKKRILG